MTRHLLIDADVLAYKAACSVEQAIEWDEGYWTWHADYNEAQAKFEAEVERIQDTLEADKVTLCLTDDEANFRLDILPTYKGNRKVKKPLVLKAIRRCLIDERGAYVRPRLEGDDIMGILSTWKKFGKGEEKVIVSIDKDMKTIPGLYVRDTETDIEEIDETAADYWHLFQTLTGDTTDGYPGCPGIGPKKAEAMLEEDPSWSTVVAAYEAKGLSETVALQNARVARILRASDYDFKNRKPRLWLPSR